MSCAPESLRPTHSPRTARSKCRLSIEPKAVRDVAIPLGGFTNVVCSFQAPRLTGATGVRRRVRTSPPVLLCRHGEVALPGPACTRDFATRVEGLLPALASEPLQISLLHHDKYTAEVLLGVATIDLAEVLSTRPATDGARIIHCQEQTVPFVAPAEGLLPAPLSAPRGAQSSAERVGGERSARHVALLDVVLRLEFEAPPSPSPTPAPAPAAAGRTLAVPPSGESPPAPARGLLGADRRWDVGEEEAKLLVWKRREQARWKAELAKREAERLDALNREWKLAERCRASGVLNLAMSSASPRHAPWEAAWIGCLRRRIVRPVPRRRRVAEARAQHRAMADVAKVLRDKVRTCRRSPLDTRLR